MYKSNIIIYQSEDGELVEESTCRKIRQVRQEGIRMVEREIPHHNLKIVQNKLHFAAHGHPAAEVIYERTDADQHIRVVELSGKWL